MLLCFLLIIIAAVNANGSHFSLVRDPAWRAVIKEEGMHIGKGRVKRLVQQNDNQACKLPSGNSGQCKNLKHCIREEYLNKGVNFKDYMCVLQGKSIEFGICCPVDVTLDGTELLAGNLPAIATQEEEKEVILKISRAENRGCGLSTRAQGRVEGPRQTYPREWPWIAFVTPYGYVQYCGGALITDRHVLTAAHCSYDQKGAVWKAEDLYVRLGEYDYNRTNDSRSYNFRVIDLIKHPEYQRSNYYHDIALLKLHKPAVFNTYVWPICLPSPGLELVNETATVIGWGKQSYKGPVSNVLMEVSVPVWDHQSCVSSFVESVFEDNICAGSYEGGRDACQGDSGGPLMYQMSSGRWVLIGVVSWGVKCGDANHPGIYTQVDKHLDWIAENARF